MNTLALARPRGPSTGVAILLPRARAAFLLACALVFAACAFKVKLVGDYDELLDQAVLELQADTNEFYARYERDGAAPSTADADAFFAQAFGSIESMSTRATVLEEGLEETPLSDNVAALKEQFEAAKALDLARKPLRTSSQKALNEAFKALQVQLVFMKKTQSQRPAG